MVYQKDRNQDEGTYDYLTKPVEEVELRSFYYGFIKTFNGIVIRCLREYFETNPRTVCFLDEEGNGTVYIAEAWGLERQSHPSVIVTGTDVNLMDMIIGSKAGGLYQTDNEGGEQEIGERLYGRIRLGATLKISAYETPTRDALSDLVLCGLAGPIKWALTKAGFPLQPDSVQAGREIQEDPDKPGQILHGREISFSAEGEWWDDFYFNGVKIRDFNLVVVKER